MSLRIAVAQISSESNHFVPGLAELNFFRATGYLLEGPSLLDLSRSDTEVGGFLSILQPDEQVEVVPLIAARANSANPLSAGCYHTLKQALLQRLQENQPVQGILLSNHGSMCARDQDDPEGDQALAARLARQLALRHWSDRQAYQVRNLTVAEAVERGRRIPGGPVLLLDTADTTGGVAAGDGITLVRRLLELRVAEPCLAMVVDPRTVQACWNQAPGTRFRVEVGHRLDSRWGKPLAVEATLLRKSDGCFRYRGGILGGAEVSMGPSVVLQVGSIQLLVMSYPTYDWACEQYESSGLDPRRAKFVCVKNMMNFRIGYGGIMKAFFVVAVPGPTPTDMRLLPFRRIRRPVYPLDALPDAITPEMTVRQYPGQ